MITDKIVFHTLWLYLDILKLLCCIIHKAVRRLTSRSHVKSRGSEISC